ncbi:MAG: hypothetical protein ABSA67_14300 [Candidatus Brocadiia bacterium]
MSNLTSDRDTEFVDELHRDEAPVAAATQIFNGAAVGLNSGGFAVPAGPGVRHFRGIADETVDNSAGAAGAETVEIITPEAAYWDSAATLTQASVGQPAYFADDHTVTLTAGTNTYAGRIKSVDRYGVLVDMRGAYVEPALPVTSAPTTAA